MGLFDFLKSKKKKDEPASQEEAGSVTELVVDPAGIDPPETRYTQEYQDFLASREDGVRGAPAREEAAEEEEEEDDWDTEDVE